MPLTSPPAGPVEWVALSFPGPVLSAGVPAPLAGLVRGGTVLGELRQAGLLRDEGFQRQKARLLG